MPDLTEKQAANIRAALTAATDGADAIRLAFAIWTESRGWIYANNGANDSNSPGFDTHLQWPAVLRRSLGIAHDLIGSNGRSTGMLQQISADVGGGWGDMVGTMDPVTSARRFLAALQVTDDPRYDGVLQKTDGTTERVTRELSSPVAADVLRVQQPLMNEALSDNYGPGQVAVAAWLVSQFWRGAPIQQQQTSPFINRLLARS